MVIFLFGVIEPIKPFKRFLYVCITNFHQQMKTLTPAVNVSV